MARRSTKHLTELELLIMRAVWHHDGDASVEDIHSALEHEGRPLALPSIRTMLKILREKGYLTREAEGKRHLYRATVTEEDAQNGILKEIVDRAFDGSATNLVAALLKSKMVRPGDTDEVKALLEKFEKDRGKGAK